MKEQFVRDLKEGDKVLSFFLVKHKQLETFRDRTRGQFLTLSLSDKTGQVLARVWEKASELAETFEEGDVVKVLGEVEEYLGRLQVIVDKLRPAKEDEYELEDFLPHTERDIEEMLTTVRETIASVENPYLRALLDKFFADEEFVAAFSRAPAARRIHHAYLGGLLEHTVEVVVLCQTVLTLYPQIHHDLLMTGALLHDVGKTKEFTYERDIDYSDEGRLLGHVVLSEQMITERMAEITDFSPELALRLRHLIISHHGRYEWGSPRRPKTLEACALHYIENLDAQVNRFAQIIAARQDKAKPWTDYDTLLKRYLYAGPPFIPPKVGGERGGEELAIEEAGPLE
jgi:3'-5' exoribonuclease